MQKTNEIFTVCIGKQYINDIRYLRSSDDRREAIEFTSYAAAIDFINTLPPGVYSIEKFFRVEKTI